MQSNLTNKQKYIVMWLDPNNSVCRKGAVQYNGKTVFNTLEEAKEALEQDKAEEYDYDPNTQVTYHIWNLNNE